MSKYFINIGANLYSLVIILLPLCYSILLCSFTLLAFVSSQEQETVFCVFARASSCIRTRRKVLCNNFGLRVFFHKKIYNYYAYVLSSDSAFSCLQFCFRFSIIGISDYHIDCTKSIPISHLLFISQITSRIIPFSLVR